MAEHAYPLQVEALRAALKLAKTLPSGYLWSLELTEADDHESPGVLNIFIPEDDEYDSAEWFLIHADMIASALGLKTPCDDSPIHRSFRITPTLLVSIIAEDNRD